MRILLAEDDRHLLASIARGLREAAHEVDLAASGPEAQALALAHAYDVIVLDVLLPGTSGLRVCEAIRERGDRVPILMLTALDAVEHRIAGLDAGADDYLTKPFDARELRARVHVGERILGLQKALADRVVALEQALTQVKQLEGLLPICAWCHKIRDDDKGNHWQSVERYVSARSDARFTHTICPDCRATVMAAPAGAAR